MRLFYVTTVLLFLCLQPYAQMPQLYLKPKQWQAFGTLAKTAPLVVVIENEKNDDDAALLVAVKNQWHSGPVSYMSELEFLEKFKSQSLDPKNLYLFNNYRQSYPYTGGVVVTMNPNKLLNAPAFHKGYYLTNSPNQLINSIKDSQAPAYLYFSRAALYDIKGIPNQGFYSLMIKNFDHEIKFCQDDASFKSKKKKKRKHGIYFFALDSIPGKTVLLVKEQTSRQEKKKESTVKKSNATEKQNVATDEYTNFKKPVVVFPEDIEYAVKKNDAGVMLYNAGCLYSAADGSVYATSQHKKQNSVAGILRITGLVLTAAAVTIFIIQTH